MRLLHKAVTPRHWPYLIALFGTGFSTWHLGTPSLWHDEAATISGANRSLSSLWGLVQSVDAVHWLYYVLIHFWGQVFGFSDWSVRLPSAIAVGVSAGLLYFVSKRLGFTDFWAITASLIFLALPRTSLASIEARSFSIGTAITIGLVLVFLMALDSNRRKLPWFWFCFLAALDIYCFLFTGLVLISFALYVVLSKREFVKPFFISTGIVIFTISPLVMLVSRQQSQISWVQGSDVLHYVYQILLSTPLGVSGLIDGLAVFAILAAFQRPNLLVVFWATMPGLTLAVYSLFVHPVFVDRYLSFTTPAMAILFTYGFMQLKTITGALKPIWFRLVAIVSGSALVMLTGTAFSASREVNAKGTEWSSIANTLAVELSSGDSVLWPDITTDSAKMLDVISIAYLDRLKKLNDLTLASTPEESKTLYGLRKPQVETQLPDSDRVAVVTDVEGVRATPIPRWLESNYIAVRTIQFTTATLQIYTRR